MGVRNMNYKREEWPRLLMAVPPSDVMRVASEISNKYKVEDFTPSQSGLGLLQLRDSALGDPFYLGEIPIVNAHIRLTTHTGEQVEGGALLLDDRQDLARAIAITDAALSANLPGSETALELLEKGSQRLQEIEKERKKILFSTRVDFSLFGMDAKEEEEDA